MLPCTFNPLHPSAGLNYAPQARKPTLLDFDRIHFGTMMAPMPIPGGGLLSPYSLQGPFGNWDPVTAATMKALNFGIFDARHGHFIQEEPKPQHSYIGLIAMAILSSVDKKMVLCDIYQWILDHYPYFRSRGPGWRNSIRHNLSLNDCFIKAGRSANGKGHYWAIHPANVDDFKRGDFRRRRAQRKVRKHMGLTGGEDGEDSDDSLCPSPTSAGRLSSDHCHVAELSKENELEINLNCRSAISSEESSKGEQPVNGTDPQAAEPQRRKRLFDVESLLAPDAKRNHCFSNVSQQYSLINSEETPNDGYSSPLNGAGAKLTNVYATVPRQQQTQSGAEASAMLFNQALSAWSFNPAAVATRGIPYGCWPSPSHVQTTGQQWAQSVANMSATSSEQLPSSLASKPERHRSPSPYSAAKWQETFAKIMARSYNWRNNPVVSKGTTSTVSGSQHAIDSSAGRHP